MINSVVVTIHGDHVTLPIMNMNREEITILPGDSMVWLHPVRTVYTDIPMTVEELKTIDYSHSNDDEQHQMKDTAKTGQHCIWDRNAGLDW